MAETVKVSKLAQEVAAKCAEELFPKMRHEDINDRLATIISEAIAPLERERDEARAERDSWEKTYHDRYYEVAERAEKAKASLSSLSRERADLVLVLNAKMEEAGKEFKRAETAETQLSSLSLAVEQLLTELETQLKVPFDVRNWIEIRKLAERARSLVVKP